MSQEEKEEVKVESTEKRTFNYFKGGQSFEFEIDVTTPDVAIVEIADFLETMKEAQTDLEKLKEKFAKKLEKPKEEKEEKGTGKAPPGKASKTGK